MFFKKKLLFNVYFLFSVLFLSCNHKQEQNIESIYLREISYSTNIKASDILYDLEYIKLETSDSCLLDKGSLFFADKQHVFAIARRQILLFNRKDGRFIRSISKVGQAPNDYTRVARMAPVNEMEKKISAYNKNGIIRYSYQGEAISCIKKPEDIFLSEIIEIAPDLFAGYSFNTEDKLYLFNPSGEIVKKYPNYRMVSSNSMLYPNCGFYRYNQKPYLFESLNDTIYSIQTESLRPEYHLDWGKHLIDLNRLGQTGSEEFCFPQYIYESDQYLFILFSQQQKNHLALFDKRNKAVFYSDKGDRLTNDIDTFAPISLSSIVDGRFVGFISPEDLLAISSEKKKALSSNTNIATLLNIEECDNPIVVVASVK